MNDYQQPNDSTLTLELREALAEVATPDRPPLAAITGRGRARQRRRLAGFTGLGVAGAAACTALALGPAGVLGAAPARSTSTPGTAPTRGTGTVQTAAFTLTSNANGTDTLTLRLTMRQMLDPAALQRALAKDGIPALVRTDTYCSSDPAPPDPRSIGVLTTKLPNGAPLKPSRPVKPPADFVVDTVTVINPAAMPSGTKLFFSYYNADHLLFADLIYASSYTCSAGQPPAT